MSEHDMKLIDKAWKVHYTEWYKITGLIERAESNEAKERLQCIQSFKYHTEEHRTGLL